MSSDVSDFLTVLTTEYRVREVGNPSLLSGPQWNATLRVETGSSILYLKRYRPRYQSSCISYSHALTGFLSDRGYEAVPRYVPANNGRTFVERNGAFYDLSEGISGEKHPMRRLDHEVLRATARELARFHNLSRQFGSRDSPEWTHSFHMHDCRPEMLSSEALQWSLLGAKERWARDVMRRALCVLQAHSARLDIRAMQREMGVAVHGDFTLDNLIFRDGRVAGVVDWESAYPDELPLYDVLKSTASFFPDRSYDGDVAALFFEAYAQEAQLGRPDPALIAAMWLFSRVKWSLKMLALMSEADVPRLLGSIEIVQAELEKPAHKAG